eukprot:jgi/Psemu1/23075/gm1.23075_g
MTLLLFASDHDGNRSFQQPWFELFHPERASKEAAAPACRTRSNAQDLLRTVISFLLFLLVPPSIPAAAASLAPVVSTASKLQALRCCGLGDWCIHGVRQSRGRVYRGMVYSRRPNYVLLLLLSPRHPNYNTAPI